MSGHSKWANIKHKKASADAKKGKVFTKMAKLITVAAQQGGGDPDMNPSLRLSIQKAKSAGVPANNIERAIKKGTGELTSDRLSEVTYEGYGPSGVAILVRCLTDNTNRSYTNVRTILSKNGGHLGSGGCVSWIFNRKGVIEASSSIDDNDSFSLSLIDAGADDLEWNGRNLVVFSSPESFEQCLNVFNKEDVQKADITLIPNEKKDITDVQTAKKILRLVLLLEEDDDVDEVFTNADFSDSILDEL